MSELHPLSWAPHSEFCTSPEALAYQEPSVGHIFIWCPSCSQPKSRPEMHVWAVQAPEWPVGQEEARRWAGLGLRRKGPTGHQRSESQASSSRRGHVQVKEGVWAQETEKCCWVRERALLLPKQIFFPLKFRHSNPSFTSLA